MTDKKKICLYLSPQMIMAIKEVAKKYEMTMSGYIRYAVLDALHEDMASEDNQE